MGSLNNFSAVNLVALLVLVLISACVPVSASPERTKTVEFNVKPGGVVHTFSQKIVSDCKVIQVLAYIPYSLFTFSSTPGHITTVKIHLNVYVSLQMCVEANSLHCSLLINSKPSNNTK